MELQGLLDAFGHAWLLVIVEAVVILRARYIQDNVTDGARR
jgi:hypothetical protein